MTTAKVKGRLTLENCYDIYSAMEEGHMGQDSVARVDDDSEFNNSTDEEPILALRELFVAPAKPCNLGNVAITGGNYTIRNEGNKVEYRCPKGKYPYPVSSRQCLRFGTWTREKEFAECRDVECPKPSVHFENGKFSPVMQKYLVGSTLHFECYDGFQLFGSSKRTCQLNGKWSGKTAICDSQREHCPNPGIPIGATKDGKDYSIEGKVTYKCHKGLKMFGSNERICQETKKWSGAEPSCRQPYTYDTPKEVAQDFGSTLSETIESSDPDRIEEKTDRKIKVKKGGLMNIFILIDASSSIGPENFDTAKEITETFMTKVSSFDFEPRYSILTYASGVIPVVTITDDKSTDDTYVLELLVESSYDEHEDKQGTNTRAALQEVVNQLSLFKVRNPDTFYKTSNVIVLLTDGKHNMGGNPVVEVSRIRNFLNITKDREDKLDIYVFGLTDEVNEDELNGIASKKPSEKHIFKMESVEELKDAFDLIIDESEVFGMCGISKERSSDEHEQYPWIATIAITRVDGVEYCKGSIVTRNFVLTAAHCFHIDDKLTWISVEVGTMSNVRDLLNHPGYKPDSKKDKHIPKSYDYDFALVELDKPLTFSSVIRPICLPCTSGASWALKLRSKEPTCQDHETLLLPRDLVDALFVSMTSDKRYYLKLEVQIKLGEKRRGCLEDAKLAPELKDVINIEDVVTDNFFCTGGTDNTVEPQTCKGDSGGPLIIEYKNRYVQVGVISWGNLNSCDKFRRLRVPSHSRDFHADVFKAMDWIKEKLKDELE
ncbi:complement factor B-like [Gastrophryne carolinensis]